MQEIREIIVPVDFHQHTDELAEFAISIANKLGAHITFFHVVEDVVFYSDFIPTYLALNTEEIFTHAKQEMNALIERNKKNCVKCTGQVSKGDIVDTILDYVQVQGMDLIVIGTHGARGIEKILLGSVAERVIKQSVCSALIFKAVKQ
jgi:nucleotide-binding universal stress UspA family protein